MSADTAPHRELRGAIQPDHEQRNGYPHLKGQRRNKPHQIVPNHRQQMFGCPEQISRLTGKAHHEHRRNQRHDRYEQQCLRDIQPRGLHLAPGQMYRSDDRTPYARHQSDTCKDHQQRNTDIDCGYPVASHAMSHENTVNGGDCRHAEHSQQCRDEKFSEQDPNIRSTPIDSISLHHTHVHFSSSPRRP